MQTITARRTPTGMYTIDHDDTRVGFAIRSAVTTVHGWFTAFDGRGYFNADDIGRSNLELAIRTDSIDTRNPRRDAHLRSPSFLDVARFSEITFVSTSVEEIEDSHYRVVGDLTIKGTTRRVPVELRLIDTGTDADGERRVAFEGKATLSRTDWGVVWNRVLEAGGVLIGNKVTVEVEGRATRTSAGTR